MTSYCGIDLGATHSHLCVIDEQGEIVLRHKLPNQADEIVATLRAVGPDATRGSPPMRLHDWIS